jgi:hypothetical protein
MVPDHPSGDGLRDAKAPANTAATMNPAVVIKRNVRRGNAGVIGAAAR